jgi:WD domain, G-beta repeat
MGNQPTRQSERPQSEKEAGEEEWGEVQYLKAHKDIVRLLVKVSDTRLASAGDDGVIMCWDWQTGGHLETLRGHTRPITCMLWLPEIEVLVSGSSDKSLCFWSLKNRNDGNDENGHDDEPSRCFQRLDGAHSGAITALERIDVDGNSIAFCSGGNDGTLRLWQHDNEFRSIGSIVRKEEEEENLHCLRYLANGDRLVTGSNSNLIIAYDVAGRCFEKLLVYHRESVRCMCTLSAELFASGSLDGTIVLWQTKTLTAHRVLQYPDRYRNSLRVYISSVSTLLPLWPNHLAAVIGSSFKVFHIDGHTVIDQRERRRRDKKAGSRPASGNHDDASSSSSSSSSANDASEDDGGNNGVAAAAAAAEAEFDDDVGNLLVSAAIIPSAEFSAAASPTLITASCDIDMWRLPLAPPRQSSPSPSPSGQQHQKVSARRALALQSIQSHSDTVNCILPLDPFTFAACSSDSYVSIVRHSKHAHDVRNHFASMQ